MKTLLVLLLVALILRSPKVAQWIATNIVCEGYEDERGFHRGKQE